MYRISSFQFYNTSEFDLAELVNDADHIAANFNSYLQGFSANVLEILMSKERGLNFGEEIDKMDKKTACFPSSRRSPSLISIPAPSTM